MNNFFIVPTPIGNLDDISIRAKEILNSVSVIFCEDIKHTRIMLNRLNIKTKLFSLNKFNEIKQEEKIFHFLKKGDVALVSDAGTPTISDPGQFLVKKLREKKIRIIPLPGPTAITTALSASGYIFNSFTFIGFLSKIEKEIVKEIKKYLSSDIIVAFETPKRIQKTLEILKKYFGDIEICIARELTKIHEEIKFEKISELSKIKSKGEFVVLINTHNIKKEKTEKNLLFLIKILKTEKITNKSIVEILSKVTNYKKNEIYNLLKEKF